MSLTSITQTPSDDETIERVKANKRRYYDNNKEAVIGRTRTWKQKNPERAREHARQTKHIQRYGITLADRDVMLAAQGLGCAICGTKSVGVKNKDWYTDHCHASGVVRGVLCHQCNMLLGCAKDSTATLSAAISYLERFQNGGQEASAG